jgi:hypothetical protein
MKKIGYSRVSTEDHTLAIQLDALRAAGCDVVHEERLSGVAAKRSGLAAALSACVAGDVLTVWKLDRREQGLTAKVLAAPPGRVDAFARAFADQLALEFREGREYAENQSAFRPCRVDCSTVARQHLDADTAHTQLVDNADQFRHRAAEPGSAR